MNSRYDIQNKNKKAILNNPTMTTLNKTKTRKMGLQPDSLFAVAMFDLDNLGRQQENLCTSQQEQALQNFHGVDTSHDVSINELFDCSDAFLSEDEDCFSLTEKTFDLSDASEDQEGGENLIYELLSPSPLNIPWGHNVASYTLLDHATYQVDSHVMPAITTPTDIRNQGYIQKPTDDHIAFDNDVLHRCTAPDFAPPMDMSKPSSMLKPVDKNRSPAITMPKDIGNRGSMHKPTDAHIALDNDVLHRYTVPNFSQPMGMSKPSSTAVSFQSRSINNDGDELWSDSDGSDCIFNSASCFRSTLEECRENASSFRSTLEKSLLTDQWTQGFIDLCRYREEKGDCLVPHDYEENLCLARWVKRYRNLYKKKQAGKSSDLTTERIKDLEDIGFVWDKNCAVWEGRLDELRKFRRVHKHCNVPLDYTNQPLVNWVRYQRRQYMCYLEGKHSTMTPERTKKLESLCFQWSLPHPYKKPSIS
jgi:hypothetical protein